MGRMRVQIGINLPVAIAQIRDWKNTSVARANVYYVFEYKNLYQSQLLFHVEASYI